MVWPTSIRIKFGEFPIHWEVFYSENFQKVGSTLEFHSFNLEFSKSKPKRILTQFCDLIIRTYVFEDGFFQNSPRFDHRFTKAQV